MENRNTIVALSLMMLLWIGYTFLYPAPQTNSVSLNNTSASVTAVVSPEVPVSVLVPAEAVAVQIPAAQLKDITIETDLYRAVVTTRGAKLKEFYLKKYNTKVDESSPLVNLVTATAQGGTVTLNGDGDFSASEQAIYSTNIPDTLLRLANTDEKKLSFSLLLPSGVMLVKTYLFNGHNYSVAIDLSVNNTSPSAKQGSLSLGLVEDTDKTLTGDIVDDTSAAATLVGSKLHMDTISSLSKEDKSYKEGVFWSGYKNKYFLNVLGSKTHQKEGVSVSKKGSVVETRFKSSALMLSSGETLSLNYFCYLGPLDYQILKDAGHDLDKAVDLGFFAVLAKPLFYVLKFFYNYVGNYGWAIILLTVLIKLIFWPLTDKSYKSMKAMQTLQPEMQKLRDKYKNDRDMLNKEIMGLYKEHRVNPLGGCLPMLVQIPVFFALYQVLMNMIELRHAPFIFWLTDLSVKDPYYITPLVMGATMFIQQKLTPSQLDPVQQKIFLIMPVVFTFLFLNFPSGLVVYWLVNNILTIAQQLSVNRIKN